MAAFRSGCRVIPSVTSGLLKHQLLRPAIGHEMNVDMVNFLSQTVVDEELVVVRYAEFVSDKLRSIKQHVQNIEGGFLEVLMLLFGNDQQMHWSARSVVSNHDCLTGFVEYLGRQVPVDDASEYGWHAANIVAEYVKAT